MNKYTFTGLIILVLSLYGCQSEIPKKTYLALGDSYTIGESVAESERWPVQLVNALTKKNIVLDSPQIIAKTGWTTDELQAGIDASILNFPYDYVSLLIGVNNQYRGRSVENFKEEFHALLLNAISFSGNRRDRVFVVSIPDWGAMPFAQGRDQEQIATEIDNYNQALYEICAIEEVEAIDVTLLSRQVDEYPQWVASDGLHPSGEQYARWVEEILPFFLNPENE